MIAEFVPLALLVLIVYVIGFVSGMLWEVPRD